MIFLFNVYTFCYGFDIIIYIGGDIMNNLKRLRDSKGISVRDLGTKLNMNYGSLSRMENGTQKISDEQAIALADFFHVSIDHLLGREWNDPDKTIIKTVDFTFNDVLHSLPKYTDKELFKLIGVIEFILEARDTPNINDQKVRNEIDKHHGEYNE